MPESGATPEGAVDRSSFRFRRRHQKSRNGCLECKKRHMKCDETRPNCLNCATVDRTCSYKDKGGGNDTVLRASSSGSERLRVDEDSTHSSRSPTGLPDLSELSTQVFTGYPTHVSPTTAGTDQQVKPIRPTHPYQSHDQHQPPLDTAPEDEPHVNMVHMELFHHFISSSYGFVEPEQLTSRLVKEIAVKHAVTSPFLMHQLLAFAARHRSSVCADRAAYFGHLATQLQTKALSLFATVDLDAVTPTERVSIFLFSSFLGFQDLCDALSLRPQTFGEFMERYLQYVHLHRGVHKVIRGSWEMLRESELRPVLDAGEIMFRASGTGSECDDLKARIAGAVGLSEEDKEACLTAVRYLQWVFDARPVVKTRVNVLLAWVPMYPDRFMQLLERGSREALCVLAYYFVLLHHCTDVWFVYESGEYLFGLLDEYLGPEWGGWLATPKELLKNHWG